MFEKFSIGSIIIGKQ